MARAAKDSATGWLFVRMVAKKQQWVVNPDPDFTGRIVDGLVTNYNRYGYFLCPCRDGDGERSSDNDICCPCAYNVPDQTQYGHCFCGLFLSPAFAATGRPPAPIPERRPDGVSG